MQTAQQSNDKSAMHVQVTTRPSS